MKRIAIRCVYTAQPNPAPPEGNKTQAYRRSSRLSIMPPHPPGPARGGFIEPSGMMHRIGCQNIPRRKTFSRVPPTQQIPCIRPARHVELLHHRRMRCGTALLVAAVTFALAACAESTTSSTATSSTAASSAAPTATPSPVATTLPPAQPRLASDPAQLADDLVADEQALRDPSSPEAVLVEAARRQQVAYRTLARNPEWEAIARPRIPPELLDIYDRNIDARHQLDALVSVRRTRCPSGGSTRRRPPTSCSAITARRRAQPASAGTTWRRST